MLTKREIEPLARAYEYILSDAWGKENEAASSEDLGGKTDEAGKAADNDDRPASILPQEALSKETNQKHIKSNEPKPK